MRIQKALGRGGRGNLTLRALSPALLRLRRGRNTRSFDQQVLVAVTMLDQRNSGSRRHRGVAHEMAHVQAKQRAGDVGNDDLGIADRKHVVPT